MAKVIERYNDMLAGKYDAATQGDFDWRAPSELENRIGKYVKKGMEVLDVGCGTGQTAKIFIDRGARVTGVDISEKMLALAGSKMVFEKLIKHDIEAGIDIFGDKKFDIVVMAGILEFVADIEKILRQARQLLKDGGIIAFTYEIYDPENAPGTKKEASLGDGMEKMPELLDFMVYRRTGAEIEGILADLNLKITSWNKFRAYYKSQKMAPVYYELLLVR